MKVNKHSSSLIQDSTKDYHIDDTTAKWVLSQTLVDALSHLM
jgi:hypothetical protein